jgi:hypothetical protein
VASIELSGNSVEACVIGRLDIPNDRQHVGRKLRQLRRARLYANTASAPCGEGERSAGDAAVRRGRAGRAVLSSLPEDERAMVEDMMRRHAGLTAAEALRAVRETGM